MEGSGQMEGKLCSIEQMWVEREREKKRRKKETRNEEMFFH